MSPEQFHDALNYLDDDLIEQTDDLRQGRRVLQSRRVISWLAPMAACLVLILGIGSGILPVWETGSSTNMESGMMYGDQLAPGEAAQDNMGSWSSQESGTSVWEIYNCGSFSLSLPEGWECEPESGEDGSLFALIRPAGAEGSIRVGYQPNFGVCGTGLQEMTDTIAGRRANVGYYDGGRIWSFITFPGTDYVILNDGADDWFSTYEKTIEQILETIEFED